MAPHEDTHLSGQHTKKDEDEHPLKSIEDCKQIGCNHGALDDVEDPKDPSSPKEEQESESTSGTGPREMQTNTNVLCIPLLLGIGNAAYVIYFFSVKA